MPYAPYLELARIPHWIKNILVLPGILIALMMGLPMPPSWHVIMLMALFAVGFAASANYVINEWLDAPFDKYHPLKKDRPSVTGRVSRGGVYLEYALLCVASLLLAAQINRMFLYNVVWLLLMGVVYNVKPLRTKEKPYLDVLSESVNNIIRFMLGWSTITSVYLPSSSILISYWMGGAFLMAVKRLAEYRYIGDRDSAALYRLSFKSYTEEKLLISILFYAIVSIFFWGVFLVKYKIEFIISVPFFALLFCWYLKLGLRENSVAQRPESLYKEYGLLSYCVFLVALLLVLTFCEIEALHTFLRTDLISI
ncbi:UbiA family prenyltransferase [Geomonas paludis]|uniref:Decaprenyl-phosphate phosphoribosyltransferase n=1 Tax=Geomonas paludis TaxID=2740185 RepID=A0A6V8MWA2_9BACT|nr:UbiA family prenyltransferase [Geomonas paludis]UPU34375.1 UbiA family prenyltransferase [Geomonas paludis]GFO64360.1 decaprenyl-phosphate phosphoribosyltransferase [Geomonas paludis]